MKAHFSDMNLSPDGRIFSLDTYIILAICSMKIRIFLNENLILVGTEQLLYEVKE